MIPSFDHSIADQPYFQVNCILRFRKVIIPIPDKAAKGY